MYKQIKAMTRYNSSTEEHHMHREIMKLHREYREALKNRHYILSDDLEERLQKYDPILEPTLAGLRQYSGLSDATIDKKENTPKFEKTMARLSECRLYHDKIDRLQEKPESEATYLLMDEQLKETFDLLKPQKQLSDFIEGYPQLESGSWDKGFLDGIGLETAKVYQEKIIEWANAASLEEGGAHGMMDYERWSFLLMRDGSIYNQMMAEGASKEEITEYTLNNIKLIVWSERLGNYIKDPSKEPYPIPAKTAENPLGLSKEEMTLFNEKIGPVYAQLVGPEALQLLNPKTSVPDMNYLGQETFAKITAGGALPKPEKSSVKPDVSIEEAKSEAVDKMFRELNKIQTKEFGEVGPARKLMLREVTETFIETSSCFEAAAAMTKKQLATDIMNTLMCAEKTKVSALFQMGFNVHPKDSKFIMDYFLGTETKLASLTPSSSKLLRELFSIRSSNGEQSYQPMKAYLKQLASVEIQSKKVEIVGILNGTLDTFNDPHMVKFSNAFSVMVLNSPGDSPKDKLFQNYFSMLKAGLEAYPEGAQVPTESFSSLLTDQAHPDPGHGPIVEAIRCVINEHPANNGDALILLEGRLRELPRSPSSSVILERLRQDPEYALTQKKVQWAAEFREKVMAEPQKLPQAESKPPFPPMGQMLEQSEMNSYVPTVPCEENTYFSEIEAEAKLLESEMAETKSLLPSGEESKLDANVEDTVELPTILADTGLPL